MRYFQSASFVDYCKEIQARLSAVDIRGILDERNETIGRKIRDTELKRIPYMLIVGEKEVEENKVAVRKQGAGDQGAMNVEDFITYFKKELEGNH